MFMVMLMFVIMLWSWSGVCNGEKGVVSNERSPAVRATHHG